MTDDARIHAGEVVSSSRTYTLHEVCVICGVEADHVIEMVSYGVVDAHGRSVEGWTFSEYDVLRSKKALRLRRDLGIDWAGLALALDLLDEVARLRVQVAAARAPRAADADNA